LKPFLFKGLKLHYERKEKQPRFTSNYQFMGV